MARRVLTCSFGRSTMKAEPTLRASRACFRRGSPAPPSPRGLLGAGGNELLIHVALLQPLVVFWPVPLPPHQELRIPLRVGTLVQNGLHIIKLLRAGVFGPGILRSRTGGADRVGGVVTAAPAVGAAGADRG
eukprot:scaffold15151_cov101-Isochrysis_galbana.AAC.1